MSVSLEDLSTIAHFNSITVLKVVFVHECTQAVLTLLLHLDMACMQGITAMIKCSRQLKITQDTTAEHEDERKESRWMINRHHGPVMVKDKGEKRVRLSHTNTCTRTNTCTHTCMVVERRAEGSESS